MASPSDRLSSANEADVPVFAFQASLDDVAFQLGENLWGLAS